MDTNHRKYIEVFPEHFSALHKVTERTEKKNFHLHKQVEIVYALSDNMKVRFEDCEIPLPAHSLLLLDSMNLHYIYSEEGSGICDRHVLYFSTEFISHLSSPELNLIDCFITGKDEPCVLLRVPEERIDCFSNLLLKMEDLSECITSVNETAAASGTNCEMPQGQALHSETVAAPALSDKSFYANEKSLQFLLGLLLIEINLLYYAQHGLKTSPLYRENTLLATKISSYIQENYRTSLDAEHLSRTFSVSKTKLYSLFREVYGITINEYVTNCRITSAKDMLINTALSVEMISDLAGYATISSFSRLFKARTGQSPLQYRKLRTQGAPTKKIF